jgi:hypothetical protein
VIVPLLLLTAQIAAIQEPYSVNYAGKLTQLERGKPPVVVKEFSVRSVLLPAGAHWQAHSLVQEASAALPWSEQFSSQTTAADPVRWNTAIGYRHDDRLELLTVMGPLLSVPAEAAPGTRWESGNASFEITAQRQVQGHECWVVECVTGPARRHELIVRQDLPLVQQLKQTIFLGQGERFELTLEVASEKQLPAAEASAAAGFAEQFRDLSLQLNRNPDDRLAELNAAQLTLVQERLAELKKAGEQADWGPFVERIGLDVATRMQRADQVAELASMFVGQAAPDFRLIQLNGREVPKEAFRDQVLILHFWGYQEAPLEQPYGQVGYLDFLANRYRDRPVAVRGVAVDQRLTVPQSREAAIRSVRRLSSFMRVGYEVTMDTGNLLNQFGNPTRLGAELPLWVVIDRTGQVVHYHTGYYPIDNVRGLRELDDVVARALQPE